MIHVISLGAGVQSSALCLMAAAGEISPMPTCAIFADTHHEPRAVYDWLDWLTPRLPFPVYRVTGGDLWKAASTIRRTRDGQRTYISTGIPIYFVNGDLGSATRKGMGKRQCTRGFKTTPITRKVKELVGLKRATKNTPVLATTWIGISADEPQRAKPSREPWIVKRHPLLELDMDREDCIAWMKAHGFPRPPRSACTFCPFHNDTEWLALTPEEFADAVVKEREIQAAYARTSFPSGIPYLHAQRIPLDQVVLVPTPAPARPLRMLFGPECEGLCGV